jgi:hypothetical protein
MKYTDEQLDRESRAANVVILVVAAVALVCAMLGVFNVEVMP